MVQISAVIITFNEEKNIARCLQALTGIAEEIIVLDSFSSDQTQNICASHGVRFYQHAFTGYVEQKNKALEYAQYPYILSLDADEVITPELKASILQVKENWDADGYYFSRLTNYCGTWIKHSNWYPDRKLRLWNRNKGKWSGVLVHEMVKLQPNSKVKVLQGDLQHYSYDSEKQFIDRTIKYAQFSAKGLSMEGKKSSYLKIIFSPTWRFIKNYLLDRGFLDGRPGFVISYYMAFGVYLKYKELLKLNKKLN